MDVAFSARVSPGFVDEVVDIAKDVGIPDPSWLMACMAFETGGLFSPTVENKVSGATGLIQFMPGTAQELGYDMDQLRDMTAEEQLIVVRQYFSRYRGRIKTLEDCYMAILWPAAIGRPPGYVLFSEGKPYLQNKGLDLDKDGKVTKWEACARVRKLLEDGMRSENLRGG